MAPVNNSPHFSPGGAKIAQDFRCAPSMAHTLRVSCGHPNLLLADLSRQRVPATESIAGPLVEEARARWREKDKRGRIAW